MTYDIVAIPTVYRGAQFRSRLEARWAAFADLAGWKWNYEPIDLNGWFVDFEFILPCQTCYEKHPLYAEVKPYRTIDEFKTHKVSEFDPLLVPSPAKFGVNPFVTEWTMKDCDEDPESGLFSLWSVANWCIWDDEWTQELWNEAGAKTQWKPR